MTQLAPTPARFVVTGAAPRYGPRDEITGSRVSLIDTAYTRAWAERLAAQADADLGPYDVCIEVRDLRPDLAALERRAAEMERCIVEAVWWPHRDDYDPDAPVPFSPLPF